MKGVSAATDSDTEFTTTKITESMRLNFLVMAFACGRSCLERCCVSFLSDDCSVL